MVNKTALVIGIVLVILAGIGAIYPVTDSGHSVIDLNHACTSNNGQLVQLFEKIFSFTIISEKCNEFKYATYAIFGLGLTGLILVAIGFVMSSRIKQETLICAYCNYVASSASDLTKHNANNHLDKSPYKCGHCDFIGITEEILWNHYAEVHPNEKRW